MGQVGDPSIDRVPLGGTKDVVAVAFPHSVTFSLRTIRGGLARSHGTGSSGGVMRGGKPCISRVGISGDHVM